MGLREDIDRSFRRLIREGVDNISDKEAKMDFDDLDDTDIDNDGDSDESDEYLHNKLGNIAKRVDETAYKEVKAKYAGRPVVIHRIGNDMTKWLVTFTKTNKTVPYADAVANLTDMSGKPIGLDESGLEEMSTTAGVPGYQTPYAFGDADEDTYGQGGMKRVKKTNRIFKPMESKSTFKKMMSEMYGVGSTINEAQKYDIIAAIKTIRDFNRGNLPDEEYMAKQVVKNLGFRPIRKNIDAAKEHLMMSRDVSNDRVPEDPDVVKELYPMLEAVSYRDYKKDPTSTPQQKVNKGIAEVNAMLSEMEKIVANNLRLKTEMGVQSNHFWKSTGTRFAKINERMTRIANKLKELSQ